MIKFETQNVMQIWVPGRAFAQTRARHTKNGVYSSASKGLKKWRSDLIREISAAMNVLRIGKLEGAVCVDMVFMIPIREVARWGMVCHTKPDKDNLEKAVLDCMEQAGVFAVGDSQVGVGQTVKMWCQPGQEGARIEISMVRVHSGPETDKAPHGALNGLDWLA